MTLMATEIDLRRLRCCDTQKTTQMAAVKEIEEVVASRDLSQVRWLETPK